MNNQASQLKKLKTSLTYLGYAIVTDVIKRVSLRFPLRNVLHVGLHTLNLNFIPVLFQSFQRFNK